MFQKIHVIHSRQPFSTQELGRARHYFWRTTLQQEIDLVEERDGFMTAFEMKWNPTKKVLFSKSFTENYPVKETITVTPDNYLEYL